MSHARCTTTSAPRKIGTRSVAETSAAPHVVFDRSSEGTRRARPTTDSIGGSHSSASTTLVPTLPVAPVTTIRMRAPSRPQDDLDAPVLLVAELPIERGPLAERRAM